jgi:hypothetical protein
MHLTGATAMNTQAASFADLSRARILVAVRALRHRELHRAGPSDPNQPEPEQAPEISPSLPHVPQPPMPNTPTVPEIGEPRVFPIHPNIPTQPIHEPVREPDHSPTR